MKKWYYLFTLSVKIRDELRSYLKQNKIYYELSSADNGYNFAVKCTQLECEKINDFLDEKCY